MIVSRRERRIGMFWVIYLQGVVIFVVTRC